MKGDCIGALALRLKVTDWLGKSDFEKVTKENGPHLIVFVAKWCGFCSRFIEQARSYQSPVELFLVDADEPDESLWDEFSIKIVPTLVVFDKGQILLRRDGKSMAGLRISDLEDGISRVSAVS